MTSVSGRVGFLVLLVAGGVVLLWSAAFADVQVERLSGPDRVATAVAVAEAAWDASGVAVVARADDYPDALAGGPLAAALNAPLLLTPGDTVPSPVADELARLGVEQVLLLGGPGALSGDVESALAEDHAVERISGDDRYATAAGIAERTAAEAGDAGRAVDEVIIASGRSFPDALSAASLVAVPGALPPIVLTEAGRLPAASSAALAQLDVQEATIVGGQAVVAEAVADEIAALGMDVDRLAGSDRYATAARVLDEALERFDGSVRPLTVATGEAFPDALAAGPLAAADEGPLAITRQGQLPDAVADVLSTHQDRFDRVAVIGGTAALSEDAVDAIRVALGQVVDDPPTDEGTREDPHPIGAAVAVGGEWELSIRAVDPDATDRVLDHNQFNEPPAAGHQFFAATVRMTFTGDEPVRSNATFRLRAVGDEGVTYSTFSDSCGVTPDEVDDRTVFPGGTIEGDVCWEIRSGDADSLAAFDDDHDPREFFSLVGGPAGDEAYPTPDAPVGTTAGSRGNPHPTGTAVALDDGWELEVAGVDRDATQRVLDRNQFNDPPADGHQFLIAEIEATYVGDEESSRFGGGFRLGAVGTAGAIGYRTFTDSCGVIPDALDDPETYRGGTITGNVCWQIRSADADSLLIYDTDTDPYPFLDLP